MIRILALAAALLLSGQALAQAIYTTPPAATPGGSSTQVQYNKTSAFTGNANLLMYDTAIAKPAAPTITVNGATGSNSYNYMVVAVGNLGYGPASDAVQITNGNATLSSSNFNAVATVAVTGSTSCDVYQFPGTIDATLGSPTYIGTVACGATLNDKGSISTPYPASNTPPSGSTVFATVDNSAGQYIGANAVIGNNAAIGVGALLGHPWTNTSGNVVLSVAGTITGTSSDYSSQDATIIQSVNNIAPASASALIGGSQYGITSFNNIPSTVTADVGIVHGVYSDTIMGGGQFENLGSYRAATFISGSSSAFAGSSIIALFDGILTESSSATIPAAYGVNVNLRHTGSGTLTTAAAFNVTGLMVATATNFYGLHVGAISSGGSGKPANFEGIRLDDNSAVGSTTSYAIHQVGAAANSLFEGQIQVASVATSGTKFTLSGCTTNTTVGGATAGSFHSGTSGTCTVVITMGGATGATAANGWACWGSDMTTPANSIQTVSTTTTATLRTTTTSGDVVVFGCVGY